MQDTSIKGNGTSRFIKGASSFPSSFEEFRRQIVAGTLTADIGLNPAGCDVVGTALSKANLLTDDVANRLGLAESKTVNEALNKLFTFAADGKKNCAAAVSAMGVPTAEGATFDTIAANIRSIKTGSDVSGVTAKASDVRSSKKFVGSDGVLRSGNLTTRGYYDVSNSAGSLNFIIPAGIYDTQVSKSARDSNLKSDNIRKGVNIFGEWGNITPIHSIHARIFSISSDQTTLIVQWEGEPIKSVEAIYVVTGETREENISNYCIVGMSLIHETKYQNRAWNGCILYKDIDTSNFYTTYGFSFYQDTQGQYKLLDMQLSAPVGEEQKQQFSIRLTDRMFPSVFYGSAKDWDNSRVILIGAG